MSLITRPVLVLLFSMLCLTPVLPDQQPAGAPPAPARISAHIWADLEADGEAEVLVVLEEQADLSAAAALADKDARAHHVFAALRETAQGSQGSLVADLRARGVKYRPFYLVNMLSLSADRDLILQLVRRPEVNRVVANPRVSVDIAAPLYGGTPAPRRQSSGAPWGIERVGAPAVWDLGIRGEGVVVAGNDTGIFWEHEALKEAYRGWDGAQADHDRNWHDAVNGRAVPYDDHGHGTHTLGVAVGFGGEDELIGMAPESHWIGCKNMDQSGYGTPARYIECFEFFLAPYPHGGDPLADGDPALAPDVVNNSWTCPPEEGCDTDTLREAVEALRSAGIVPVFSAGNYGSGGCGTVHYPPAVYDAAFSVGAFGVGDVIASFSSRGPVVADSSGRLKPDVAAPGVSVRSSNSRGGYSNSGGTSSAAPHVAGQVALMISASSQLRGRVDDIEEIIIHTTESRVAPYPCGGEDPGVVPNNTWGHGIIDADYAVQAALVWPSPVPTATPSPTATPTSTAGPATPTPTATPTPGTIWSVYLPLSV
jgi:subtilisin family serine protease